MVETAPLQLLRDPLFEKKKLQVYIKREDLLHPTIAGNKWRKLKYNLQEARIQNKTALLTFGGAYSNHIAAVAAAGKEFNFQTVGFIRGEEHVPLNPTLDLATQNGMQLIYLDRETYRQKNDSEFKRLLQQEYPNAYILPEGGTNTLALKGCTEIIQDIAVPFDYICCAVGTGGTLAGIIAGLNNKKKVIGFPALKGGHFLQKDIIHLIEQYNKGEYSNWELQTDYHFGGYAKIKPELINFIQSFKEQHNLQLDPVYTGKMMYGIYDLVQQDFFATGTIIVAVHTGGLQGLAGMQQRFNVVL